MLTSREAMNYDRSSNKNMVMLLLDFEKAYDKIQYSFLTMILDAFGLPKILSYGSYPIEG